MEPRILHKQLHTHIGEVVTLNGWVDTIRDMGGISFLQLRDKTGITQVVCGEAVNAETSGLTRESVVSISGVVREDERASDGIEVEAQSIRVLSLADPALPIAIGAQKGNSETEAAKRFDWRWIDLRDPEKKKIFDVWTAFEKGARSFFYVENFIQVYPPAFMSTSSESGAELFEVNYFGRKAYLAQSPQFYKQMAMAAGFERVFMTGPVFRAEPSFTTRHATEFTGWDFELSFIDSHHDVMDMEEQMLIAGISQVNEDLGLSITVPTKPFPRITMKQAKEKLQEAGVASEKDGDVSPEEERALSAIIKEETGHDFVFIIDWPIESRPFYHMRHEDNSQLTKSFDLLYKGVEITTGSQREHRVSKLQEQAVEKGMELESLEHYLNFFRYGCPPHGGVGIGPVRIIMKMLDLPNIREATFLPRDVHRLTP